MSNKREDCQSFCRFFFLAIIGFLPVFLARFCKQNTISLTYYFSVGAVKRHLPLCHAISQVAQSVSAFGRIHPQNAQPRCFVCGSAAKILFDCSFCQAVKSCLKDSCFARRNDHLATCLRLRLKYKRAFRERVSEYLEGEFNMECFSISHFDPLARPTHGR